MHQRHYSASLFIFICTFFLTYHAKTQDVLSDKIYKSSIKSVKFHMYGDQLGYPIINLNGSDRLELHFDDMDGDVKSYYYTYQLCNADWTPAMYSQFDYIKGFFQNRISTYRLSNVALTKYTHYQAFLPEQNSFPSKSGNYVLKVFLNGNESNIVFTKRFLVVDSKTGINAQIQQPLNATLMRTHHKIQFSLETSALQITNPRQEIKVVILQNYRWDNPIKDIQPTFNRGNVLEYNTENDCIFPGYREWRWLNLSSFRLQSDRVDSAHYTNKTTEIFVKPDGDRKKIPYYYYHDQDGMYYIGGGIDNLNPYWQSDYATVHFTYVPPLNQFIKDKELYLYGELTNYELNDNSRMHFNSEKGVYEATLFLKNGYYDFSYALKDKKGNIELIDNNYWETENQYTILVYYRPFGGRADQLVGVSKLNSYANSAGIRFGTNNQ
ncbi:MAG: DUF5103 domain-containing protein [Sphingobacteriales bacterium]|nr:MAG: DUF5103 domain-containing protein [Sphingobacteriales bacterium]